MRGYTFETQSKQVREEIFEALFKSIKDVEAFALRDIILNKWDRNGMYYAGLVIADEVASSIFLVFENKNGDMTPKVRLDSDFGPDNISIPNEVNISITWKIDSPNRYKVIKQNFAKIKEMINGGSSAEEIGKVFDIELTEDECRKLAEREKM